MVFLYRKTLNIPGICKKHPYFKYCNAAMLTCLPVTAWSVCLKFHPLLTVPGCFDTYFDICSPEDKTHKVNLRTMAHRSVLHDQIIVKNKNKKPYLVICQNKIKIIILDPTEQYIHKHLKYWDLGIQLSTKCAWRYFCRPWKQFCWRLVKSSLCS